MYLVFTFLEGNKYDLTYSVNGSLEGEKSKECKGGTAEERIVIQFSYLDILKIK